MYFGKTAVWGLKQVGLTAQEQELGGIECSIRKAPGATHWAYGESGHSLVVWD